MTSPPLTALRTLEVVIRRRSLQAAASELCVTHGAISQQLKALEDWCGHTLFSKVGRSLEPTALALDIAADLTPAFERISRASRALKAGTREDTLTVASIPSFAARVLVPALPSLSSLDPPIQVRVMYAHRDSNISVDDVDALIQIFEADYDGPGTATSLLPGAARPVCSPSYLRRVGPLKKPADLAKAHLLHDWDSSAWKQWFSIAGVERVGHLPGPVFEDFGLLSTAATAGHGVALCPIALIQDDLKRGDLVELFDLEIHRNWEYILVLPPSASSVAERFHSWLLQVVSVMERPAPSRRQVETP
jgi:LysR family transcriptional regulator, glycine cleavage system transcriptional activator